MKNTGIPSLDLGDFLSGNKELKQQFVNDLGAAYAEIGFVSIKNHGISKKTIDTLYDKIKEFFALPEEIKKKYELAETGGQRGYTSFGKEHAKDSNEGDLKEFWHFGQEVHSHEYPQNVHVSEIPDFLRTGLKAYKEFEMSGRNILKAIALYLDLDEDYFEKYVINGNSILRPIHYPPIENTSTSAVRAGAHEDINLITLLIGASAEGLQVLTHKGEWIDVTAIEGHIIVNVGDMLQRLTNGVLRSTTHRVINPEGNKALTSRYSVPFFLHPISSMPLNCLDSCVKTQKLFEDITAGEYLTERLREIGLM